MTKKLSKYKCSVDDIMKWGPCLTREGVQVYFSDFGFRYVDFNRIMFLVNSGTLYGLPAVWVLLRNEMLPKRVINKLKQWRKDCLYTSEEIDCDPWGYAKEFVKEYNGRPNNRKNKMRINTLFSYIVSTTDVMSHEVLKKIDEMWVEKEW